MSDCQLINQNIVSDIKSTLGDLLYTHNLCINSRKLRAGDIFCAYPGTIADGRDFIPQAINDGASFILYEEGYDLSIAIASLAVKNLAQYVGILASEALHSPSTKLYTIGVTGTNGKTSISHWLNQAYSLLNNKTAIIGTTGCGIYPNLNDYATTTPDPLLLQHLFNEFVTNKVDIVAMEVSSHALAQGRVNGVAFKQAIFTNLTQDHLDYHVTMEAYYQAKKRLFDWDNLEYAIINTDDEYGQRLYNELPQRQMKFSYGICNPADLTAQNISLGLWGARFELHYNNECALVESKVIGEFNISNVLAVAASLLLRGIKFTEIAKIIANLNPVVGRMETISIENGPLVVVDFAHTPDALQNALQALQNIENRGKLYCVFGCGGNRDKTKRKLMGNIAQRLADIAVVTSDNPRFEEPDLIVADIVEDITQYDNVKRIVDRKDAILQTIANAQSGDIILIAGKGHENYQEINGVKHHFSDQEIVQEFIKKGA